LGYYLETTCLLPRWHLRLGRGWEGKIKFSFGQLGEEEDISPEGMEYVHCGGEFHSSVNMRRCFTPLQQPYGGLATP
jgi:hypothetical protein